MANALYAKGRESFLKGEISWNSDNIKCALVDSGVYTPNLTTDQYLTDVTAGGAVIATSGNMSGKTTTAGVADCDDFSFTAVTGVQSEYLVFYKDTGSAATSRLICLIDTATNLAVTPNGSNIDIALDSGANKLFKL